MATLRSVATALVFLAFAPVHGSPTIPIVVRELPASPRFVVMPGGDSAAQVKFADEIESYLVGLRLRVTNRPAVKEVRQTVSTGAASASVGTASDESKAVSAEQTQTRRFFEFSDSKADLFLLASDKEPSQGRSVRIVKRSSRELLATLFVPTGRSAESYMFHAMVALGVLPDDVSRKVPSSAKFEQRLVVPDHPTFTVYSGNPFSVEVALSRDVESYLQTIGAKVILPPRVEYVVDQKGAGKIGGDASSQNTDQSTRSEQYWQRDLSGVDFVVETSTLGDGKRVRVIDVATNEIRAVFRIDTRNPEMVKEVRRRFGGQIQGSSVNWRLETLRHELELAGVLAN